MKIHGTINPSFLPFFLTSSISIFSSFWYVKKKPSTSCFPPITTLSPCCPSQTKLLQENVMSSSWEVPICPLHLLVFYFSPTSIRLFHPNPSTGTTLAKFGNGLELVKSISLFLLASVKHSALWTTPSFKALTSWTSWLPRSLGVFRLSFPFLTVLSSFARP